MSECCSLNQNTISKIVLLVSLTTIRGLIKGETLPGSIEELQHYYGDGTSNELSNVFYKILPNNQDLQSQSAEKVREHLTVSDWYGFDDEHIETFVKNMKLISETNIEKSEDLEMLRSRLYEPDDFQTSLLTGLVLEDRDDAEKASVAFDKVFISLENSMVQLYYTSDEDIFNGIIVAAKRKNSVHAVYLVFVID